MREVALDYKHKDGDLCIEFHDQPSPYRYAVGRWNKGLFEWMGKDFKFHRYQGMKVLFTWESAVNIVRRLEGARDV